MHQYAMCVALVVYQSAASPDNGGAKDGYVESRRVGVAALTGGPEDPALADSATRLVMSDARRLGFDLVTREALDSAVREFGKNGECSDPRCLSRVGNENDADGIVTGVVRRWGHGFFVKLCYVRVRSTAVQCPFTVLTEDSGISLDELLDVGVEILLVPEQQRTPGSLRITDTPPDAEIILDGGTIGFGSHVYSPVKLGVHLLQINAEGYESVVTHVPVRQNETTTYSATLIKERPGAAARLVSWVLLATLAVSLLAVVLIRLTRRKSARSA